MKIHIIWPWIHTKAANIHLHNVAYAPAKVVTSTGLGGGEIHYMALIIWVRVTREAAQYPLHYVTYVPSLKLLFQQFLQVTWKTLGLMDRLLIDFCYEIIIYFFYFKKNTKLNQLMPCDKATIMPYAFAPLLTFIINYYFHTSIYSIGPVDFFFMGCLVVFFCLYSNLKDHSVSKL